MSELIAGRHGWSLRRRLANAFGVLAVLGLVLIAVVVVSTTLFVRAGDQVIYRWQPAVVRAQRLLADYVDEETGVRGYVISGNPSFLAPYRAAQANQRGDLTRLGQLIGADGRLRDRLARLRAAATTWQQQTADPIVDAMVRGPNGAARIAASDSARHQFDAIRSAAAALSDDLATRTVQARSERTDAGYVFVAALAASLAVLVAAGLLLWRGLARWVVRPLDRLGAQTRVVAAGDTHRVIVAEGPREITGLGRDVEAMREQIAAQLAHAERITAQLQRAADDLARSNEDLQQFAYVASHDLSEPLRKVANFCQLLERQYGPQLDDRARQYIDFAVDGAKRMQTLINDLLELSRVGRTTEAFVPVDLRSVLDSALRTLADLVAEAGARVEVTGELPSVDGDRSLLTSLLVNLVGNAVKYRSVAAPVVTVGARLATDGATWEITVADNGIGIDPQYAERIFVVFQRLHLRDQYGGTGIGLALCRRIVEFHGGHIRLVTGEESGSPDVESAPGATFRFTLPARTRPAGDPTESDDDAHGRD